MFTGSTLRQSLPPKSLTEVTPAAVPRARACPPDTAHALSAATERLEDGGSALERRRFRDGWGVERATLSGDRNEKNSRSSSGAMRRGRSDSRSIQSVVHKVDGQVA